MNKKVTVIVCVIIALILAAFAYVWLAAPNTLPEDASTTPPQTTANDNTPPVSQQQSAVTPQPGTYKAYDAAAISSVQGRKIIFFHAPWCPQCRDLEKSITAGPLPNDLTIFKTDYDSSTALRQKYGVTIQTTLVEVDKDGTLLKKHVAYDEPSLAALKRAFGIE